jgi:hypothetical protein
MNAKVFTTGSGNELELALNQWLKEEPNIVINYQTTNHCHDLLSYGAPQVCNQWYETTVYYTPSYAFPWPESRRSVK